MMTESLLLVGDIHGCAAQLQALLDNNGAHQGRRVIFLGDYVDVGHDSKGTIDSLIAFSETRPESIFLRGNHDAALERYLLHGDFAGYAAVGGLPTIRSYCGEVFDDVRQALKSAIPPEHEAFLADLQTFVESDAYLFSHCGYAPEDPLDRSFTNMVLQSHQALFLGGASLRKLAVCGHYFQRTLVPFISDRVICLDTGCGILNGPLTALQLPELLIVQVHPDLHSTTTRALDRQA
jgi:serine/threonine protein phosphatase 1